MISQVMPDELPLVWRYLEKQIMSGLSRGQGDECYPEKMYEGVLDGTSQMWAMHDETELDAVIILSVEDSATRKVWVDLLAGDNLTKWADELESTLVDFKKSVGASCIEASCRSGLAKFLRKRGWKKKATIMSL